MSLVVWIQSHDAHGAASRLASCAAVGIRAWLSPEECARMASAVLAARDEWTSAFDGEQFSLGRAFYTDFEEERARTYFDDAGASDARVERHLPGLQSRLCALAASITGSSAHARRGWCGAGVHVFPARGHVAQHGGVVHFDTEGLSAHHLARARRALSVVVMLQPPASGGGLRVWNARWSGADQATDDELASESAVAEYRAGDVVVIDSHRLHQIQPFEGERDRISATIHAAEIDPGRWETWF